MCRRKWGTGRTLWDSALRGGTHGVSSRASPCPARRPAQGVPHGLSPGPDEGAAPGGVRSVPLPTRESCGSRYGVLSVSGGVSCSWSHVWGAASSTNKAASAAVVRVCWAIRRSAVVAVGGTLPTRVQPRSATCRAVVRSRMWARRTASLFTPSMKTPRHTGPCGGLVLGSLHPSGVV